MKLLILNGPNLNMLGIREPSVYGKQTYADLCDFIRQSAEQCGVAAEIIQSNAEGELVAAIQQAYGQFDGIVLNPAAYTHTSIAILDALKAVSLPCVEVHLSDIAKREDFRKRSYVSLYAEKSFIGMGFDGYKKAIEYLNEKYRTL